MIIEQNNHELGQRGLVRIVIKTTPIIYRIWDVLVAFKVTDLFNKPLKCSQLCHCYYNNVSSCISSVISIGCLLSLYMGGSIKLFVRC